MNYRRQVQLPDNAEQLRSFITAPRTLRLERVSESIEETYRQGKVLDMRIISRTIAKVTAKYDDGSSANLKVYYNDAQGKWLTSSGSRALVCYEAEEAAKPIEATAGLQIGDIVRIEFDGAHKGKRGTVENVQKEFAHVRLDDMKHIGAIGYRQSNLLLVERPLATPVEPPKPKEEFSEVGVMPSDHPGINEMLKKGFKEVFGGEMPAPAKRTLPSSKALFITASERYMGLGSNDSIGGA